LLFFFITLISCEKSFIYEDFEQETESEIQIQDGPRLMYVVHTSTPDIVSELTTRIPKEQLKRSALYRYLDRKRFF